MEMNFTFKIGACFSGDLIHGLSGIKHVCESNNTKADIYLWLDRPVKSYEGAQHPYNGKGFNQYTYNMLKPLIESQSYVASFNIWRGEECKVDLDEMRGRIQVPIMPYGSLTRWPGYAWPDMQCDLSNAWIDVYSEMRHDGKYPSMFGYEKTHGKIIINRTSRYQNGIIHYWFLKEFKDNVVFAGMEEEHQAFCKEWQLDIPLLKVQDFLELAIALKSCRYFIGNQSMCFALAEAMKIPRLLEACPYAPNIIPCGNGGYDFLHQFALEWMVKDKESPFNKL